ncbi:MAG: type II toxin-antitoxin system RelE/ParE family toxin [Methanosarcinales archaeon]|nr:type II toxin-antitoxin system RelE/ParE family toxin [Methanosarcinales archaeon]
MSYKIEYKSSVVRDLKKLDKSVAGRILDQLEMDLSENPDGGQPLTGQFKGLFKYRIGDYRIIYTRTVEGILVLRIGHRSKVYR